MPILIRGAGGGGASLQSKVVTPSSKQQIILPDSGYDGLDKVTVAAEKVIYCDSSRRAQAKGYNEGQYLALSGISDMMPYDRKNDVMDLAHIVIIRAEDRTSCSGREITDLILLLEKSGTNNMFNEVILSCAKANGSGQASSLTSNRWGLGQVTYTQSANKIDIKIADYQFTRTDGYGYQFSTTGYYEYIVLLAERPS